MKIMTCPLNGPRNIQEFVCLGEVKDMPDPASCPDEDWADYLFLENNIAGEVDEWWLHVPSLNYFIARRNTISDDIIWTRTVADYFAERAP